MSVRLRYTANAAGYVAHWAGLWASPVYATREHAEQIRAAAVNGEWMEVVEV